MKLKPHSVYKKKDAEEYLTTDFLINKELIWTHKVERGSAPCGFVNGGGGVVQIPVAEFERDYTFIRSIE
jgi:hypothetical protein